MRRAVARGRMFPQSYSTDRRYGRLSLKAIALFPLMWANADDQGRLCGDPEEVKYAVCPNIDHITKADMPTLLEELQTNKLIKIYETPKSPAIQLLDWWDANRKMQWAWPSEYLPPEGWKDRLRYKKSAKEVVTQNWSPDSSGENPLSTQVNNPESSPEFSGEDDLIDVLNKTLQEISESVDSLAQHEIIKHTLANLGRSAGFDIQSEYQTNKGRIDLCWLRKNRVIYAFEIDYKTPKDKSLEKLKDLPDTKAYIILRKPYIHLEELEKREPEKRINQTITKKYKKSTIRGRGNSPEFSGEKTPSTSPLANLNDFFKGFRYSFGKSFDSREEAQMRDLFKEISSAGGATPKQVWDAFKEAANMSKPHISYVRAVLCDWLGLPRERSP
jgi:hypothetical protein